MNTPAKLSAYGLVLAAVFAAAWTIGAAAGPLDTNSAPTPAVGGYGHDHQSPNTGAAPPTPPPTGSTNGYQLSLNPGWPLAFRITNPDGAAVTRFASPDGVPLRLSLTRLDPSGRQQQLHPTMTPDGTWHTPLTPALGTYQIRAEFTPENAPPAVLDSTIHVTG